MQSRTPRVTTLRIANGPFAGHRVTVEADEDGNPPRDVFVREVHGRAVPASQDVRWLDCSGWTAYASQRAMVNGTPGWELVEVTGRAPAST